MGVVAACAGPFLVVLSIALNGCGGGSGVPIDDTKCGPALSPNRINSSPTLGSSPGSAVLLRCETGDQHGWPSFDGPADLQTSPWGKYFELVYGQIPSTGYPICTLGQTCLYMPHLVAAGLVVGANLLSPNRTLTRGCPTQKGDWFYGGSWIWNPNLVSPASGALPSNVWVEGIHRAAVDDGDATWFYYAPGSALWVYLGETKAYDDHPDAVQDLLGGHCGDDPLGECAMCFSALYQAMSAHNLTTIQFLKHSDMGCGEGEAVEYRNLQVEIVEARGPGTYACGQQDSGRTRFKAGWQAQHDCICDNTVADGMMNCKGFGISSNVPNDYIAVSVVA